MRRTHEALCDTGHMPRWVGGTSIGVINAAIIARNRPEHRVSRLRQFWDGLPVVCSDGLSPSTRWPARSRLQVMHSAPHNYAPMNREFFFGNREPCLRKDEGILPCC